MRNGNSYLRFFQEFYSKWKLDYEKKKIELWREMRHLNSDLLLYTPSVNHKNDNHGTKGSKSAGTRSLSILSTFWDDLDQVREIEHAISKMSEKYKKAFFDYYIHGKKDYAKEDPFLKEETLIEIASHDADYIFADEIKKNYDKEKMIVFDKIAKRRTDIKVNFFKLLEKHKKFLSERMLEKDIQYLKERRRSGAYRNKEAMYIDVLRYLEGDIDGKELWRCISSYNGGKKLFKNIFKG